MCRGDGLGITGKGPVRGSSFIPLDTIFYVKFLVRKTGDLIDFLRGWKKGQFCCVMM